MNKVLSDAIQIRIQALHDNDFQDFIDELYQTKFDSNYLPVKQKRDQGCDGILNKDTVLSCYSPEKYDLKTFKRKLKDDFVKYSKNWEAKHKGWMVVYNGDFTSENIKFLEDLKKDVQLKPRSEVIKTIESLPWGKIRKICEFLGVDESYIINDLIGEIIDDLLKKDGDKDFNVKNEKPIYIEDKIKLNFSKEDVETAKTNYEECLTYFPTLQSNLKSYKDTELSALKSRITGDYSKLNGTFKEKLNHLADLYKKKNGGDDIYEFFIRVVLLHFFEQCLIGRKTEAETK